MWNIARGAEWSCLNRNLLPEWGMPIEFINYAVAMWEKVYLLWGGSGGGYENMLDGNGTAHTALVLWNGILCDNMSWSFSPETINSGSWATLGGQQSAWVIDRKMESVPFLFQSGNNCEAESEGKGGGNKRKPHRGRPPLALSKEVSFTVTMILVNGPWVTTYCDATKQNKNLISSKWKPLLWKHLN